MSSKISNLGSWERRVQHKLPPAAGTANKGHSLRSWSIWLMVAGMAASTLHFGDTLRDGIAVPPLTTIMATRPMDANSSSGFNANRRKFVSYHSSPLEQLWLDHVDEWVKNTSICSQLMLDQEATIRELITLTCTTHMPAPHEEWCVIDDVFYPLWFNKANVTGFEIHAGRPDTVPESVLVPPPLPVRPTTNHEHLVSKFVFLDELTGETYVEYIEPLVSHLRAPLSMCLNFIAPADVSNFTEKQVWEHFHLGSMLHRGYVIPPPTLERHKRHYYFDAGSSSWMDGGGGPSLHYFVTMWKRHGIDFSEINAFEMTTPVDQFYLDVPKEYEDRTHYQQCAVSSKIEDHSLTTPFIPWVIQQKTTPDDYVFFKLDIDSASVEDGSILHILADKNTNVDEIAWEHHVAGNYLMKLAWGPHAAQLTLRESYEYFLKMRKKGIRAHSWI